MQPIRVFIPPAGEAKFHRMIELERLRWHGIPWDHGTLYLIHIAPGQVPLRQRILTEIEGAVHFPHPHGTDTLSEHHVAAVPHLKNVKVGDSPRSLWQAIHDHSGSPFAHPDA